MSKGGKSTSTSETKVDPRLMNEFWNTYGDFNTMTGGKSFIPDLSGDTTDYFSRVRGIQGQEPLTAEGYVSQGFVPQQSGAVGNVGDISGIPTVSGQSAADYIERFMNPALRDVVDTSLADYDTGVDRAMTARSASADAGSAFGNRRAIADAVYQADTARGRGALSAGLRSNAFDTALGAAQGDASRFQGADTFNAGTALQTALANQSNQARNFDRSMQNNQFNTGQYNTAAQFNLGAANRASEFGAGERNRFALSNRDNDLMRLGLLGEAGSRQDQYKLMKSQEPLDLMRQRMAYLSGIPVEQTMTGTTRTNPGLMGSLGSLGTAAFGLGSLGWNPFGSK